MAQPAARLPGSEERFRLMVESVVDYAIFMLDQRGHVATWNVGAERLKGYSADEIIGRHFRTFYPDEAQQSQHPEHELQVAMREGRYEEEGWRIRKDGSRFWANVVITALFDETGEHVGFAKVTRDMTERRRAQEELRRSEERFRLMIEGVLDYAIFMLDQRGHVATWNAGAQRLKGYSADEIIGRHFRTFYPDEAQQSQHPEHELQVAMREGRYEEEGWRIRKDGSRFWANVVITALFDETGEHVGFAKVTRDMTERRRAQQQQERAAEELTVANRELQEAVEQTGDFLALTAHELQTPLTVIAGGAQTLLRSGDALKPAQQAQLLDAIVRGGARIQRLIEDLLTAARLHAGTFELALEEVDLGEPVAAAVAEAGGGSGSGIEVTGVDGVVVHVDPLRLQQIVANLLSNALKYGAAPVKVAAVRSSGAVELHVEDSGPGVLEELEPRLFEKFSRAPGQRARGTGLGLFIVREIARAHGGDARYERAREGGARFVVRLPA